MKDTPEAHFVHRFNHHVAQRGSTFSFLPRGSPWSVFFFHHVPQRERFFFHHVPQRGSAQPTNTEHFVHLSPPRASPLTEHFVHKYCSLKESLYWAWRLEKGDKNSACADSTGARCKGKIRSPR